MNPKDIYQELIETGEEWAKAHEAAELLRETQKILRAKLMRESNESSNAAKELSAISNPTYEEHVKMTVNATGEEARARVRYDRVKIQADMWRTLNANERAANRNAT